MTEGKLSVTLVECDRLMQASGACSVFCTVAIGEWEGLECGKTLCVQVGGANHR